MHAQVKRVRFTFGTCLQKNRLRFPRTWRIWRQGLLFGSTEQWGSDPVRLSSLTDRVRLESLNYEGSDVMKFTFGPESRPLDGYTIKRAIARGGFGEVYYALTDSGKEVAIKLLQENLEVELRGVTQCLNLKHPNLVTIFDIKQDRDGDHWIVMEYVGGKTLDRVIHEQPNGLPLADVLAWLDGIAAGIGFLHDRGIVHRDLKPANLFRENGVVKVGDIGLSKFIAPSRRSAHTQSVGTVYYMAPEVAKGRYGREVDVYSLAVILYELLTGKVPFDGETTAEILMKHLTERPNLDLIAPNLRPVFERALEKDPQQRTADVLELARQFRAAAMGNDRVFASAMNGTASADNGSRSLNDTPPFPQPEIPKADRKLQAGSLHYETPPFPQADRPRSAWYEFCWLSGRGVGSVIAMWKRHPLLITGVVGLLVLPITGQAIGVRPMPLVGGARMLWLIAAVVVAAEIFRLVSRGVDWLFRPEPSWPKTGDNPVRRSVRLNPKRENPPPDYRAVDPNTVRDISWYRRAAELSGSLAVAGLATAVVTTVLATVTQFFPSPGLLTHFAAGTLLGTWGLLILGKFREGQPRERYIDRLLLAGAGLVLGIALFQFDEWLLVELPSDGWNQQQSLLAMTSASLTGNPRQVLLESYVAFFATLFGLRRWWWQTDSYRPHRFRVLSVLLTTMIGAVAALAWGFPVLWGTVWAASLSCVVQLAAVWTPQEQRR